MKEVWEPQASYLPMSFPYLPLLSFTNPPGQKTDQFTVPQILFGLKTSPSDSSCLTSCTCPCIFEMFEIPLIVTSSSKLLYYGRNIKYKPLGLYYNTAVFSSAYLFSLGYK